MSKKLLSILIVICMLCTVLPVSVLAEEMVGMASTTNSGTSEEQVQDSENSDEGSESDNLLGEIPDSIIEYNIWVGSTQVTSANKDNITGDGISGTVSYNPDTTTLILNEAKITSASQHPVLGDSSRQGMDCIYAEQPIAIKLVGNNTIIGQTGSDTHSYGIYTKGNLNIHGNGSLDVSSSTGAVTAAIYSNGKLNISDTNVTAVVDRANYTSYTIYGSTGTEILNSTITATGANSMVSFGICDFSKLLIQNSTVVSTAAKNALYSPSTKISNSTVTLSGNTNVLNGAPTLENVTATASTDIDGSNLVPFKAEDITTYKYMKTLPKEDLTTTAEIHFIDPGGYELKVKENQEVKIGDTLTAPDIDGYTPFMFFSYGFTFIGGSTGMYDSNAIGSFEAPASTATIENIVSSSSDKRIYIYYFKTVYTISGTIKGIDTNSGIAGAVVKLKNEAGDVIDTGITDSVGVYTFSNITAGNYNIEVNANGYENGTIDNFVVSGANTTGQDLTLTKTVIFIPVTDITMTNNNSVQVNTNLTLMGTVYPDTATNKTIIWSVENANGTEATIRENIFRATAAGTATLKATVINGLAVGSDYTKTFEMIVNVPPVKTHSITATAGTGGSISPNGSIMVNDGESQTFTITPDSNYSIADVKVDNVSQGKISSYTFRNILENHTISAIFTYNGGGEDFSYDSSSSSSNNDDNSNVTIITPPADQPNNPTQSEIKLEGRVDGNNNVIVNITAKNVTDAFDKAVAEAKKNNNVENGIALVLRMDTDGKDISTIRVNLPKNVQDVIIDKKIVNTVLVVDNPDIKIDMDLATILEINKQSNSDVNITAERINNNSNNLGMGAKNAIGSRPVFDMKVSYGSGKQVQNFGTGNISVAIPYILGANESADRVKAVYVDIDGRMYWLNNSVYNNTKNVLEFNTNHFSIYGIGYKEDILSFTDIANHWGCEDIEFVVSHGLLNGTSQTTFSPDAPMTRAMFVTALGRMANTDVSNYNQSNFADVKKDTYYMSYIEWANKNNIIEGIGGGKFAPDQSITREQMAVIMHNYANAIGFILPNVNIENTFTDSIKISSYAKEPVKKVQMAGVIMGKNSNIFDPQGTATRAESSAVMSRFMELMISDTNKL